MCRWNSHRHRRPTQIQSNGHALLLAPRQTTPRPISCLLEISNKHFSWLPIQKSSNQTSHNSTPNLRTKQCQDALTKSSTTQITTTKLQGCVQTYYSKWSVRVLIKMFKPKIAIGGYLPHTNTYHNIQTYYYILEMRVSLPMLEIRMCRPIILNVPNDQSHTSYPLTDHHD